MKVGDTMRVINPDALNYGRVGRIDYVFPDGCRLVFSARWGDFGCYKWEDVEPAGITVPSMETPVPITEIRSDGTTPSTVLEAIKRIELQRALVGDCGPTTWDEQALDAFLSLIANSKEGGTSHE